jgi:hypothetical protein
MEAGLVAVLQADAGVSAIVAGRIHPTSDPQSAALPKVTYAVVGSVNGSRLGTFSNDGPTGLAIERVQFDCLAIDLYTARLLARAVKHALNGGFGVQGGVQYCGVNIVDLRESPLPLRFGQEKPTMRFVVIASVPYKDA